MRRQKSRLRSAISVAVTLSILVACGHEEKMWQPTFAPPPAGIRESLTTVAVVPIGCDATYDIRTPAKGGEGVSSGATQGALWGATPGLAFCAIPPHIGCGLGAPAAIAGAIVGAIPGAIVGAAKAHSAEEVNAAETTLRQIIRETPADVSLVDLIVGKASERGVNGRVERVDMPAPAEEPTFEDLMTQGFTSVIRVSVPAFFLLSTKPLYADTPIDPSVSLLIGAQVRVERLGQPDAWTRAWLYRAASHSFFDLAANDGSRLRESINAGLSAVATKVMDDVFLSDVTESYPEPRTYQDVAAGVVRPVLSCVKIKD